MSWRLTHPRYLIGHWPLNNHAYDVSGYGNHGTWTTESYVEGPFQKSVGVFGGVTSKISMGDILDIGTNDFSISAWVKTSAAGTLGIVSKEEAANPRWSLYIEGGLVTFRMINAAGTTRLVNTLNTYNDNAWHHVVSSNKRAAGALGFTLIIDGAQPTYNTRNTILTDDLTSVHTFGIGAQRVGSGAGFFNGNICNVRMYNIELTNDEAITLGRRERRM